MLPTTLPQLESDRLILRNIEPSDAEAFQVICNDEDMARGTGLIPFPYPEGEAARWIDEKLAALREGMGGAFAITIKESGQVVGDVSLEVTETQGCVEVGYVVGREFKGRGFATEALKRIVQWYFETTPHHRLFANCFCSNPASARILEKAGFQREGLLRQNFCQGDRLEDDYIYGLIRADFESNRLEPTT
ncbi:MAG: GNAT family N-acetyltransferase [Planctomycetota bacterium]|nr:GNAT family N-acetyltransferase [Planctomycetota bacterium]